MPPITGKKPSALTPFSGSLDAVNDVLPIERNASGTVEKISPAQLAAGANTNFAENDLTAAGNRVHDFGGNSLTINQLLHLILNTQGDFSIVANSAGELMYVQADGTAAKLILHATDLVNSSLIQLLKNGNIDIFANAGVNLAPQGGANTVQLRFKELAANGNHHAGFKAPDAIAADVIWALPASDGAAGEVLKTDGAGNLSFGPGAAPSYDSLSSGAVTAEVARHGGSAAALSNPADGEYTLTIPSGAHFIRATVFGNYATLNGSNEMLIRIDNAANTRDRRVMVQLYDANNGGLVDQQASATNHKQTVSGNVTLLTIPGLNDFGAAGFYVEIH